MAHVTVVNDNAAFLELVADILEDDRYSVTLVDGDREDALERIRESRPDVLMIDLRMGTEQFHGWDVAQQVRKDPGLEGLPILICSADVTALAHVKDQLDEAHDVAVLEKPFQIDALTNAMDQLLAHATALEPA